MTQTGGKITRFLDDQLGLKPADNGKFLALFLAAAALAGLLVVLTTPWKAFAVVSALLVFLAAFYRPELIVLFLALFIPLEPFLLKFVSDEVYVYARYFSESLVYVLAASVALRVILRRRRIHATPLDLPFIFFLIVAAASLLVNAVPPFIGLLGLRQIIRFILLFFVIVYLDPDKPFVKRLTLVMFGITLFEGVLGGIQALAGGGLDQFLIPSERRFYESIQLTSGTTQFWSPGTRVFATMGRYDQLGTFLCFFFLLAVGLLYTVKDKRWRQGLWVILLASLPGFIMTLSRASWFGLAGGVILIGAILMKDNRVRLALAALIIAALGYAGVSGLVIKYMTEYPSQTPVERFFEAFSYERWRGEYYGLGRLYWIVQTPLVVVRSSPILGVGPGQFGGGAAAALGNTAVYEKLNLPFGVGGTGGYIDNNWFSLWGETGTLGVFFYGWLLWAMAAIAYRTWRRSRDELTRGLALGFVGCVAAVSFQAFLATYFEVRTLALYLWLYGALIYVLARHEKIYA